MNLSEDEKLKVIEMYARKFPLVHQAIESLTAMTNIKDIIDSTTDFIDDSSRLAFECFYENVMERIAYFLNDQAKMESLKNSN